MYGYVGNLINLCKINEYYTFLYHLDIHRTTFLEIICHFREMALTVKTDNYVSTYFFLIIFIIFLCRNNFGNCIPTKHWTFQSIFFRPIRLPTNTYHNSSCCRVASGWRATSVNSAHVPRMLNIEHIVVVFESLLRTFACSFLADNVRIVYSCVFECVYGRTYTNDMYDERPRTIALSCVWIMCSVYMLRCSSIRYANAQRTTIVSQWVLRAALSATDTLLPICG